MLVNTKRRRHCCRCYPKRLTDYLDLFAQPVYQMTFRDSYVVSTCLGSICTIFFIFGLVGVLFSKTILYLENNASTFTVTEGIDYGYYSVDSEFDKHSMAIGLIYRPEYQAQMDLVVSASTFTKFLDTLVDIQMFT